LWPPLRLLLARKEGIKKATAITKIAAALRWAVGSIPPATRFDKQKVTEYD